MDKMEDFSSLAKLNVTSKDGKCIVPAVIEIFENFQVSINDMLGTLKQEFSGLLSVQSEKITLLESEVSSLKKSVLKLEEKIDEFECSERRDTLIISGKKLPTFQPGENIVETLPDFLKNSMNTIISPSDISSAHRIGPKPKNQQPDKRSIAVKFCKREVKKDLLVSARRVKPVDLYINESLTPQRQEIFYGMRRAKREYPNIISGCASIDGSVYVWIKSPNQVPGMRDLRLKLNSFDKFQAFCSETLKKPITHFLG